MPVTQGKNREEQRNGDGKKLAKSQNFPALFLWFSLLILFLSLAPHRGWQS